MNATRGPQGAGDNAEGVQDAWTLAVDLGCAQLAAAVTTGDGVAHALEFDGAPAMPSGVWMDSDGLFVTGTAATRQALLAPQRWEPAPVRMLGEPREYQLGGAPFEPVDAVAQVLAHVLEAARERLGRAPERTVLIHPQPWPDTRSAVLADAGRRAGLNGVHLLGAAAAAGQYLCAARRVAPGGTVAVLDVGAGSVSTAVIRRDGDALEVLGSEWADGLGGNSFDLAIFTRVVRSVLSLHDPRLELPLLNPPDARWRRVRETMMREVRRAREELTRHGTVRVHTDAVADASLELTRHDLDVLIRPEIDRMVAQLRTTLASAGVSPQSLDGLALLGGAGATPLLARAIVASIGQVPRVVPEPQLALALGGVTGVPARSRSAVPAGAGSAGAGSPAGAGSVGSAAGGGRAAEAPPVAGQRRSSEVSPAGGLQVIASAAPAVAPVTEPDTAPVTEPGTAPVTEPVTETGPDRELPVPAGFVVPDPETLVPSYVAKRLESAALPAVQPPTAQSRPARPWVMMTLVALLAVVATVTAAAIRPSGSVPQPPGASTGLSGRSAQPTTADDGSADSADSADSGTIGTADTRWQAWGEADDLARTWSAVVPLEPGAEGSRGQRCKVVPVDSPFSVHKILCAYPNDVRLTLLQYASQADRDRREKQIGAPRGVERSEFTGTDLEGTALTGTLYTDDDRVWRWLALDGPGGGERRSAVYTRWPGHTAGELKTWWTTYAPFT